MSSSCTILRPFFVAAVLYHPCLLISIVGEIRLPSKARILFRWSTVRIAVHRAFSFNCILSSLVGPFVST